MTDSICSCSVLEGRSIDAPGELPSQIATAIAMNAPVTQCDGRPSVAKRPREGLDRYRRSLPKTVGSLLMRFEGEH